MSHDIALPAEPPYVVVIFRSLRTDVTDGYAEAAAQMESLVTEQPGYLSHWTSRDADGRGVTLSYWTDEAAAQAWKGVAEHRVVQGRGARDWYEAYSTEVAVVHRSYSHEQGIPEGS
jgi:heme-degrading monooxygenase HmoA